MIQRPDHCFAKKTAISGKSNLGSSLSQNASTPMPQGQCCACTWHGRHESSKAFQTLRNARKLHALSRHAQTLGAALGFGALA